MRLSLLLVPVLMVACVKPKLYQAEQLARQQAEAREIILHQELTDRKLEVAKLTDQVGTLNRTIGNQESQIQQLKLESNTRMQQAGDVSNRLLAEKQQLEQQLADKNRVLNDRTDLLQRIKEVQDRRTQLLTQLAQVLADSFRTENEIAVNIQGETIEVLWPDQLVFEPAGLMPSAKGRVLMGKLAGIMTTRPALDVEMVAYTDNALPKGAKNMADTWDWALQRATNLTRTLIRDYGVNANQLTPIGKGEFYPVATNETPEGRQKNRRTILIFKPTLPVVPAAQYQN